MSTGKCNDCRERIVGNNEKLAAKQNFIRVIMIICIIGILLAFVVGG